MPRIDNIPDPLVDKFTLAELPRIAPWVAEELDLVGRPQIEHRLSEMGLDAQAPQHMSTWVKIVTEQHGALWEALQVR